MNGGTMSDREQQWRTEAIEARRSQAKQAAERREK